jgi:hypothetical protein
MVHFGSILRTPGPCQFSLDTATLHKDGRMRLALGAAAAVMGRSAEQ